MKSFAILSMTLLLMVVSTSAMAGKLVLDGQEIELAPGSDVLIDPITGNIQITSASGELVCSELAPEPPTIAGFSRTPSSLLAGGTVNFTYTTQNAVSCQASSNSTLPGWSGSKPVQAPTGSPVSVTIPAGTAAAQYQAGLTCTNGSQSVTSPSLAVTVTAPTSPECANRPPPAGMTRAISVIQGISDDGQTWSSVMGQPFPGQGSGRDFALQRDQYAAIAFNTGNIAPTAWHRVSFAGSTNGTPGGPKQVSISTCPGDFNPGLDVRCHKHGHLHAISEGAFKYGGPQAPTSEFACRLDPNTTYYLNIVYTDSPNTPPDNAWKCGSSPQSSTCGNLMTPYQ